MSFRTPKNVRRLAKSALAFAVFCFVAAAVWHVLITVGYDQDSVPGEALSNEESDTDLSEEKGEEMDFTKERKISEAESVQDLATYPDFDEEITAIVHGLSLEDSFIEKLHAIVSSEVSNYRERHNAVQRLSHALDEHEIRALYRFLLVGPPDGDVLRKRDRALKNDVLNRLRVQQESPAGLTEVLVAMFEDSEQDEVVRDYALQQMREWREDAPLDDHELILRTLARGLKETESSIGATALLAFRQFDEIVDTSGYADVSQMALEMVGSDTTEELSRVTALQVAAESNPSEIFDTAAQWALDSEASYPRRLSGIAALGASGTAEAAAVLARVEAFEDPYLQPALRTASAKLRQAGIE